MGETKRNPFYFPVDENSLAAILAAKRSAGVTRGNSKDSVVHRQQSTQVRAFTVTSKPRVDINRSSN